MSASEAKQFDEVLVAMDVVDTLRHEQNLVESELSGDARRNALVEKLRGIYRAQGLDVPDDVLQKGVAALEERRFVHEPLKPGLNRTLATIYVRRGKYALRGAVAAVAIVAAVAVPKTIYHYTVTVPAEKAASELNVLLTEKLPRELEDAAKAALLAGKDLPNVDAQRSSVERLKLDGQAALSAKDADKARKAIAAINGIRKDFETTALARQKEIETKELARQREIEAKANAERLTAESASLIADARAAAKSPSAASAVETLSVDLERVAKAGDLGAYNTAKAKLVNLTDEIKLPLTVKIVDRPGEKSGVWRMRNNDQRTKTFYIVVEAIRPDGKAVPRQIHNVETGKTESVTTWAIQVPEETYNKVGKDKTSDGIINDRDVGTKPAGTLDIGWSVKTDGKTITKW